MDASPEPQQHSAAPLLRKKRKRFSFFILFAGIAVFIAAAGALYFALRPETLRMAVGPSNSDDQKLIQALAATFTRQRTAIRLAPIPTDGPTESPRAPGSGQDRPCGGARRSRYAGRCAIGGDPAQECRRAVVAVGPSRQGIQKSASAQNQDFSRIWRDIASA